MDQRSADIVVARYFIRRDTGKMGRVIHVAFQTGCLTLTLAARFCFCANGISIAPQTMTQAATVDERFQSFNVEMVEVTGGRFWAPYKSAGTAEASTAAKTSVPGIDPAGFRMRPPIDLTNAWLRKLAAALGPSYMRVSGTWANSTYFHDSDALAPAAPKSGAMERYTLTADGAGLLDARVRLNGKALELSEGEDLPELGGVAVKGKSVELEPGSITFLAFEKAGNGSCW